MLLYVTVVVHPLVPIICDAWCHSFSEINHLATVHAKYGTHHLEISLSKTGDKNEDKNLSKTSYSDSEHILIKSDKNSSTHKDCTHYLPLVRPKTLPIFLGITTPPPKFYC